MPRILLVLAATLTFALASLSVTLSAKAADTMAPSRGRVAASNPYCHEIQRCGPAGCKSYQVCTRPCPDGYSCAPLYGAYGPYGGVLYWGGYTDSGWTYSR